MRSLPVYGMVLGLVACGGGTQSAGPTTTTVLPTTSTTARPVTTTAPATTTTRPAATNTTEFAATVKAELTEVYDFPGAADKGSLGLALTAGKAEVCYELRLRETDRPTETHIHEGASGSEASVVLTLNPRIGMPGQTRGQPGDGRGGYAVGRGCQPADAALVERLLAEPASFSADVHTQLAPAGAVRGRFSR